MELGIGYVEVTPAAMTPDELNEVDRRPATVGHRELEHRWKAVWL
jgi:hypothetical protein